MKIKMGCESESLTLSGRECKVADKTTESRVSITRVRQDGLTKYHFDVRRVSTLFERRKISTCLLTNYGWITLDKRMFVNPLICFLLSGVRSGVFMILFFMFTSLFLLKLDIQLKEWVEVIKYFNGLDEN